MLDKETITKVLHSWSADKDVICFPCLMFESCSTENYKKCIGDRSYAGYEVAEGFKEHMEKLEDEIYEEEED
jgi:hypothetical protein